MGVTTGATALLVLLLLLFFIIILSSSSSSTAQGRTIITISHTSSAPSNTIPIQIGTPVQSLSVGFDTSSDVALLPCETLRSATAVDCQSDLCKLVPNHGCKADGSCYFSMTYGDSSVHAVLKQDRAFFGGDLIKKFTFGCVLGSDGTSFPRKQGLLGLGRGNLSLLHQSDSKYKSTFSLCLPNLSITSSTGSLTLGPADGQAYTPHNSPLLQSLRRPSLYFLPLQSIWVDGNRILDFQKYFTPQYSSAAPGTVVDSGLAFTSLVSWVYTALTTAVHQKMPGRPLVTVPHFDTCYNSTFTLNSITFKFRFFDLRLTKQQFIYKPDATTECLAFRSAPNNINRNLNIIAGYQLQNKRLLINEHLKFLRIADATTTC